MEIRIVESLRTIPEERLNNFQKELTIQKCCLYCFICQTSRIIHHL